jgi:hypothetical protein
VGEGAGAVDGRPPPRRSAGPPTAANVMRMQDALLLGGTDARRKRSAFWVLLGLAAAIASAGRGQWADRRTDPSADDRPGGGARDGHRWGVRGRAVRRVGHPARRGDRDLAGPTLAVVGILLQSGQLTDALGARLLFATNAAAIIATGTAVFLGTGCGRSPSRPASPSDGWRADPRRGGRTGPGHRRPARVRHREPRQRPPHQAHGRSDRERVGGRAGVGGHGAGGARRPGSTSWRWDLRRRSTRMTCAPSSTRRGWRTSTSASTSSSAGPESCPATGDLAGRGVRGRGPCPSPAGRGRAGSAVRAGRPRAGRRRRCRRGTPRRRTSAGSGSPRRSRHR